MAYRDKVTVVVVVVVVVVSVGKEKQPIARVFAALGGGRIV